MSIDRPKPSLIARGEPSLPCLGHLKTLLNCKTARVVPPQHVIFSQGESPHTICLICKGFVKLSRTESSGNRAIVGLRKQGWLLGASAILTGLPYATTGETVTQSKLCFVPIEQFQRAIDTNIQFSKWVSKTLGSGVYSSVISISNQNCLSGRQRLEGFLLELIQGKLIRNADKAIKIPFPLKHWEVAQLLGLTPEHLCRLVKKMENEAIIERENGWLILKNPKKLSLYRKASSEFSESN